MKLGDSLREQDEFTPSWLQLTFWAGCLGSSPSSPMRLGVHPTFREQRTQSTFPHRRIHNAPHPSPIGPSSPSLTVSPISVSPSPGGVSFAGVPHPSSPGPLTLFSPPVFLKGDLNVQACRGYTLLSLQSCALHSPALNPQNLCYGLDVSPHIHLLKL